MAKLSKSEVKAAISAILAREEPQPPVQPGRFPRRNLGRRFEPILAAAGIDVSQLERVAAEERKEFARYQKKREQYYERLNSNLANQYAATLKNKKLALEAIASQTVGVETIPIHTAYAVVSKPSEIPADKKLEPWNNWVKFYHHDPNDTGESYTPGWTKQVSVKFFFAWLNSPDYTSIININADLIIRGYCSALAQGGFITPGSAYLRLDAVLKAYPGLGTGIWGPRVQILKLEADTYADIFGGDGSWAYGHFNHMTNVWLKHLLVKPRHLVIFEVSVDCWYRLSNGIAEIEFTSQNRKVTCPALIIERGGEPTIGPG